MINKPRLTAGQMAQIRNLSDEIGRILENAVSDISEELVIENHPNLDFDNPEDEEIMIDLGIEYMGIMADMILQDIRREF